MLILLYLAAIVAANLSVAYFGPYVSIINSFLFIGLDITTRDALHERWEGKHLWVKMALLILAGSVLSWLLNRDAGRIALASFAAFAAAGAADTAVYHLMRHQPKLRRVNGSNTVSAAVDSVVFPTIAFGSLMPTIVAGQFLAKVAGGYIWALLLNRLFWRHEQVPGR